MKIHVVQPGETIYSIAALYGISATKLIRDNDLLNQNKLVVGQSIVIAYPQQTYTVQKGDTLYSIANEHGVSFMELLRNNPHLSERASLYPGETIIISYNNNKGKVATDGYAFPFIDKKILRKTLPFLTYLSILNYRTTGDGGVASIEDDTDVIQIAKEYGVAPIMFLSTLTREGEGSLEAAYNILTNQELVEIHISNILRILKEKGYYGLNITFQFLTNENTEIYENYINRLFSRLNREGYSVIITLNPRIIYEEDELSFEKIDYSFIPQKSNGVTLMSYHWGYSYGPPSASTNVFLERKYLDYAVTQIPSKLIYLGLPVIGYDWQLPYEKGISRANSLSTTSALTIAAEFDAIIQYDEIAQAPYFYYSDLSTGNPHMVWFKDARSIDAIVNLVQEYELQGLGIWNIMQYFSQMWVVINSQYEIAKVLT